MTVPTWSSSSEQTSDIPLCPSGTLKPPYSESEDYFRVPLSEKGRQGKQQREEGVELRRITTKKITEYWKQDKEDAGPADCRI
ncbi:hypothetical protein NDU88_000053 [Pleurodeles waltl]|uniref:Uncharacterized protein n=1 Tax=Pleurodeles waltl TaxID=8319 RepID=A0AAV7KVV7_PLEWA|nr:hypothetical protein NDU88_000053 [Pleurodeles waltl]